MDLLTLNRSFGIPGVVDFVPGPGGLASARIRNTFAEATVTLHGGHVISYTPHGQADLLWLSQHSHFADGKPIRGGIPVCWPWFGAHPEDPRLPAHGFARLEAWKVTAASILDDGATQLTLTLPARPGQAALWPHRFSLKIVVTVSQQLAVELIAVNIGDAPFTCTAALHSYFRVGDIASATVTGLEGAGYIDTVDGKNVPGTQEGPIGFTAETDRIYQDTIAPCLIHDPALGRTIRVAKGGSRTTVVWNPWVAKSARMPDFGDEEYHGMLCVEAANARNDAITLAPGQSHTLRTVISAAPA